MELTEEDKINDAMLQLEADSCGSGDDDDDDDDDGGSDGEGGVVDLEDLGKAMRSGQAEAKVVCSIHDLPPRLTQLHSPVAFPHWAATHLYSMLLLSCRCLGHIGGHDP